MAKAISLTRHLGGRIAALLLSALLLMWVALANGYPLLFSDSGTYLRIGTELYFPNDRPVTYGLMLLPFVRVGGVWLAVAAQCLAAAWLIGRLLTVVGIRGAWMLPAVVAMLCAGTSLPWFTGQLMPDVLTGLGGLIVLLIVCGWDGLARWERVALPLALAGCVAAHLSHLPIFAATAVAAGLPRWRRPVGAGAALVAVMFGLLVVCSFNLVGAGRFVPSLQSDAFLLAKLLDQRMAQAPLAEACAQGELPRLCSARKRFDRQDDPMPGQSWLWALDTPRVALAAADEQALAAEEKALVGRTLSARSGEIIPMAIASTARQLVTARTGDGIQYWGPEMQVQQQVAALGDSAAFAASRQQNGRLGGMGRGLHLPVALLSALLVLVLAWAAWRRRDPFAGGLILGTIVLVVANAAVCGILSGVFDRYQSRIIWVLPLIAMVLLVRQRRAAD
ncbi:hypothetical protein [Sphingomonas jatrophae]|nr:hypothetical protein [Sphingomonas jatrophae]